MLKEHLVLFPSFIIYFFSDRKTQRVLKRECHDMIYVVREFLGGSLLWADRLQETNGEETGRPSGRKHFSPNERLGCCGLQW